MIKMEKGYLERLKENQDYYGLTKLIQINKENYKKDLTNRTEFVRVQIETKKTQKSNRR